MTTNHPDSGDPMTTDTPTPDDATLAERIRSEAAIADDIPHDKARISDLVRWAVNAITAAECVAAREARIRAEAWDEAANEGHDCGWMHKPGRADLIGRNPYRARGVDGGAS